MVTLKRDRYVVFKIIVENKDQENNITINTIRRDIWATYNKLFGLLKSSEAGLFFEDYLEDKFMGIIRCSQLSLSNLLIVMAITTKINNNNIIIFPIFITGLINKAKKILQLYTKF